MIYKKHKIERKSDKNMTDKYNLLKISFVKLYCHIVKFLLIEST